MNRRTFLQQSSLIIPGLSVSGILGVSAKWLFAKNNHPGSFSLSVITDRPEKALALVQDLLSRVDLPDKNIRYTEYILQGNHLADIAYTRNGRLIDFRKENQPLCDELHTIANQLDLPRSCDNPLLAHFSCNQGVQKPTGVRVFKDNALIIEKSFPTDMEHIHLDGPKGKVVLELGRDRSVRIAETSCTHKTCMTMGAISQAGQNLVCIPNRIAVSISGTSISGVDSFTF